MTTTASVAEHAMTTTSYLVADCAPCTRSVRFQIFGSPRTKKTSQRVVNIRARGGGRGFTKILPSKAHAEWFHDVLLQGPALRPQLEEQGFALPITGPVNVAAVFYLEANRGDLLGYLQALADALQAPVPDPKRPGKLRRDGLGIIRDDVQIVSVDGSRLAKDANCPRIDVDLTVLGVGQAEMQFQEVAHG